MSILIKGIDMPQDGCHHTITIYADGSVACGMRNTYSAIEIPKHGRLIDADRMMTDRMKSKYYHLKNGDIAIPIIDIEHAPTVVEGEEE